MIGNSLTFQRQLLPKKKPIFRSEFERKGTVPFYRHYLMFFSVTAAQSHLNLLYLNVIMCSLLCTKIWKLLICEVASKHVKFVNKDDVHYDNQIFITSILVREFTPSSMWIKCIVYITFAIMHFWVIVCFLKISLNKANKLNK